MTLEEFMEGIDRIQEAWNAFTQSITDAAQMLQDLFRRLGESDEIWPGRNGTPPKKYGMSLHRRARPSPPRYQFVPVAPRNRPYQRRMF